jgi:hypothetical protein
MICAYEACEGVKEFEPKTHNQKYCSDECCKIATSLKIKEKQQRAKDRKAGKKFKCKACNAELNRYNQDEICEGCKIKNKQYERKLLVEMLNGVS